MKTKPKLQLSKTAKLAKPEASVNWGQLRLEFPLTDVPSRALMEILRYILEGAVITGKDALPEEMEKKIERFLDER